MENNNTKTTDMLNNEVSNDKSVLLEDALENGFNNRNLILEKYMEELRNIEERKCYINYDCANIYYDLDDLEISKLYLDESLKCAELLGLVKAEPIVSTPEARTQQYYAKRPCVQMVEEAARIWCDYLSGNIK